MKGYVQIYTGNGKGKTTATFGLVLRALGASKRVFFAQFVKGEMYSEIKAIRNFSPLIEVKQFGLGCFIVNSPIEADIEAAQKGQTVIKEIIHSAKYDLIVLDEIFIALFYKLISEQEVIEIIQNKPKSLELALTGRYASTKII